MSTAISMGLMYFLLDDDLRRQVPIYYAYGEKRLMRTFKEYRRALDRAKRLAPRQHKFAEMLVMRHGVGNGIVPHHTPFLL